MLRTSLIRQVEQNFEADTASQVGQSLFGVRLRVSTLRTLSLLGAVPVI
jgi:hypothetical protein